jgi:hypothetical protein
MVALGERVGHRGRGVVDDLVGALGTYGVLVTQDARGPYSWNRTAFMEGPPDRRRAWSASRTKCFEFEARRQLYVYFEFVATRLWVHAGHAADRHEQLAAYFALMEVSSLLQHAVDQQLHDRAA